MGRSLSLGPGLPLLACLHDGSRPRHLRLGNCRNVAGPRNRLLRCADIRAGASLAAAAACRGFSIGQRLVDEFLAKSKTQRCSDFREAAEKVAKAGFRMFLNTTATVANWNAEGTECSLVGGSWVGHARPGNGWQLLASRFLPALCLRLPPGSRALQQADPHVCGHTRPGGQPEARHCGLHKGHWGGGPQRQQLQPPPPPCRSSVRPVHRSGQRSASAAFLLGRQALGVVPRCPAALLAPCCALCGPSPAPLSHPSPSLPRPARPDPGGQPADRLCGASRGAGAAQVLQPALRRDPGGAGDGGDAGLLPACLHACLHGVACLSPARGLLPAWLPGLRPRLHYLACSLAGRGGLLGCCCQPACLLGVGRHRA